MAKYLDIQYYILPIYSHKLCFPGSSDGDEMYNVNSPIIRRKLHLYLKKFPIRKISDLDGFTRKFYQTFKEITILHNLSQKTKELNTLQLMKPVLP